MLAFGRINSYLYPPFDLVKSVAVGSLGPTTYLTESANDQGTTVTDLKHFPILIFFAWPYCFVIAWSFLLFPTGIYSIVQFLMRYNYEPVRKLY